MEQDPNETARRAFGDVPQPLTSPAPPAAERADEPRRPAAEGGALASWGTRALAFALDSLLITGVLVALSLAATALGAGDQRRIVTSVVYFVGVPLGLLYAPLLMARRGAANGQTVGKQMMAIRVVREDGRPFTFWNGLMRQVVGQQLLAGLTFYVWALVDYLWPLPDPRNQALHDKLARTLVIRTARPDAAAWDTRTAPFEAAPEAPPSARRVDGAPAGEWLPPRPGG